jgi:chemotaxis protein histidine kinase CheA
MGCTEDMKVTLMDERYVQQDKAMKKLDDQNRVLCEENRELCEELDAMRCVHDHILLLDTGIMQRANDLIEQEKIAADAAEDAIESAKEMKQHLELMIAFQEADDEEKAEAAAAAEKAKAAAAEAPAATHTHTTFHTDGEMEQLIHDSEGVVEELQSKLADMAHMSAKKEKNKKAAAVEAAAAAEEPAAEAPAVPVSDLDQIMDDLEDEELDDLFVSV